MAEEITCPDKSLNFTHLILPGVGHWTEGTRKLDDGGWRPTINSAAESGVFILGVCLGMQLLGRMSEEGEGVGLGLLDFHTVRHKVNGEGATNVGWQVVSELGLERSMTTSSLRFYFTHSFCVPKNNKSFEWLESSTNPVFIAGVRHGNIWGMQFHPERSAKSGAQILHEFASQC